LTHELILATANRWASVKSHAKQNPSLEKRDFHFEFKMWGGKKKNRAPPGKTWQGKGFANSILNLYIMGNSTSKNTDYSNLSSSRVEDTVLCEYVDLAAQSMGSTILRASDEFFGAAANILKPDAVKHNDDDDTGN
jgi:hypothetical protein